MSKKYEFLTADVDQNKHIAQANSTMDKDSTLNEALVACRYRGDFPRVKPARVEYMDVSPKHWLALP